MPEYGSSRLFTNFVTGRKLPLREDKTSHHHGNLFDSSIQRKPKESEHFKELQEQKHINAKLRKQLHELSNMSPAPSTDLLEDAENTSEPQSIPPQSSSSSSSALSAETAARIKPMKELLKS